MLTALTSKSYRKALFNRLSGFSAAAELPAGGRAEQRLSRAMFMVLGRIAKMDGRVTQTRGRLCRPNYAPHGFDCWETTWGNRCL